MIPDDTTVTVPAQLLQSLIFNIELGNAGAEDLIAWERAALEQCEELQAFLEGLDPDAAEMEGLSFDDCENVSFANFIKRTWC